MKDEDANPNDQLVPSKQDSPSHHILTTKTNIYKNLIVVSFSYLLQFSALNGLTNLQSSLNSHANLGVFALLCASFSFLISCLFVPVFMCKLLGFKWSLILGQSVALPYIICNYFPSFYTFIPASIAFGAALSVLWTLQGSYIVHLAHEYNKAYTNEPHPEKVMIKFFGIFMILFQMNQIFGNLISAVVLNDKFLEWINPNYEQNRSISLNLFSNISNPATCGINDCFGQSTEIVRPNDQQVFWLCACFFVLSSLGTLLLVTLMDDIRPSTGELGSLLESVAEIFKLFLNKKLWALLPMLAFLASLNTFITVDFSKSFVACLYGIHYIGNSFIVCGISSSVFSFLVSQLTKLINKTLILIMALVSAMVIMAYLNIAHSFSFNQVVYVIPAAFGLLEGVWGTVFNTLVGTAFLDQQLIAFSNNRFSVSVFFFLAYSYSGKLCVYWKTYIVFGLSLAAIISASILEVMIRTERKNKLSQPSSVKT